MKNLFLTSSFCDVAQLLENFCGFELIGKTVSFIPTASIVEEYTLYVENDKKAFEDLGIIVNVLHLNQSSEEEITIALNENDIIYISGGNTFYLLQELRKTKTDQKIIKQINNGKLYIGASAGSMILAPDLNYIKELDNPEKAKDLTNFKGLNVIDFYPLPHFGNQPFTEIVNKIYNENKDLLHLIPINNSQVIAIKNNEMNILGDN